MFTCILPVINGGTYYLGGGAISLTTYKCDVVVVHTVKFVLVVQCMIVQLYNFRFHGIED